MTKSIVLQAATELLGPRLTEANQKPDFSHLDPGPFMAMLDDDKASRKKAPEYTKREEAAIQTIKDWKAGNLPVNKAQVGEQIQNFKRRLEDWMDAWSGDVAHSVGLAYYHAPGFTQISSVARKIEGLISKAKEEDKPTVQKWASILKALIPLSEAAKWLKDNVGKVVLADKEATDVSKLDVQGPLAAINLELGGYNAKHLKNGLTKLANGKAELDKNTVSDLYGNLSGYVSSVFHKHSMKRFDSGIDYQAGQDFSSEIEETGQYRNWENTVAKAKAYAANESKPEPLRKIAGDIASDIEPFLGLLSQLKALHGKYNPSKEEKDKEELSKFASTKSIKIIADLADKVTTEFYESFVEQLKKRYTRDVDDYLKNRSSEHESPYAYYSKKRSQLHHAVDALTRTGNYGNGWEKGSEFEKRLNAMARRQADDAKGKFKYKMVKKVSPIVEHKSSIKEAKPIRIVSGPTGFEGTVRIEFEDGSGFTVDNKAVYVFEARTPFLRYPTTFRDVTFPDGSGGSFVPEETMHLKFLGRKLASTGQDDAKDEIKVPE